MGVRRRSARAAPRPSATGLIGWAKRPLGEEASSPRERRKKRGGLCLGAAPTAQCLLVSGRRGTQRDGGVDEHYPACPASMSAGSAAGDVLGAEETSAAEPAEPASPPAAAPAAVSLDPEAVPAAAPPRPKPAAVSLDLGTIPDTPVIPVSRARGKLAMVGRMRSESTPSSPEETQFLADAESESASATPREEGDTPSDHGSSYDKFKGHANKIRRGARIAGLRRTSVAAIEQVHQVPCSSGRTAHSPLSFADGRGGSTVDASTTTNHHHQLTVPPRAQLPTHRMWSHCLAASRPTMPA